MGDLVVVGDAFLDRDLDGRARGLAPDDPVPVIDEEHVTERPGGAGLTALLARRRLDPRAGRVLLVAPLADDDDGRRLRALLAAAGVELAAWPHPGRTVVKQRLRAGGRLVARVDRHQRAAGAVDPPPPATARRVADADAVLVADYGLGAARAATGGLGPTTRPVVWDPHPRGGPPSPGAWMVTPNAAELVPDAGDDLGRIRAAADRARRRWRSRSVAVTLGSRGALLVDGSDAPPLVPAEPVDGDTCGAGDCFAAGAAIALAAGATLTEATAAAVAAATAYVRDGGPAALGTPPAPPQPPGTGAAALGLDAAIELLGGVRATGGRTVATGGCFDVLHPGHLQTLRGARRLGDALVVCLNSDASVARLKGPDRPLVPDQDRAAVLAALPEVDAVVVFDDDTPGRVLDALRPDLFVKGGDYGGQQLEETALLRSWGGEVVILPYLDGRSTTGYLAGQARRRS